MVNKTTVKAKPTASINTKNTKINLDYLTDPRGWRLINVTSSKPCDINNDGILTTDTKSEMPLCMLDDTLFIKKETHIAFYKRGINCCDDPTDNTYNWTLKETIFTMSQGGIDDALHIQSLNGTEMTVTTNMEAQGEIYRFTVVFGH